MGETWGGDADKQAILWLTGIAWEGSSSYDDRDESRSRTDVRDERNDVMSASCVSPGLPSKYRPLHVQTALLKAF